jgi:hypothetical protein
MTRTDENLDRRGSTVSIGAFVVVMEGHKQREVLRRALHLLRDLKHGNRG